MKTLGQITSRIKWLNERLLLWDKNYPLLETSWGKEKMRNIKKQYIKEIEECHALLINFTYGRIGTKI